MIKKLKKQNTWGECLEKLNELISAVNNQQIQLNNHECRLLDLQNRVTALDDPSYHEDEDSDWYDDPKYREQPADNSEKANCQENVQDKFAEQRKWIGKLCKFWDMDEDYYYYGPLTKICDISPYYYECNNRICYAHCEPVSEDLIYKGE